MTCRATPATTYANRPRTAADMRKTAQLFALPTEPFRRAYRRGLEMGQRLAEQAPARVSWTVRPATADAMTLGIAVGALLGAFARPMHPLLALSLLCLALGSALIARLVFFGRRR